MIIYALIAELKLNSLPLKKATGVPMKSTLPHTLLLLLATAALSGCDRYRVSLNDNPIYNPRPLYADFEVLDEALDTCIRQTIADQRIHDIEQLIALNCSNAGIRTLEGLERFAWLQKLDLSANSIGNASALRELPHLQYAKLTQNPQLNCADLPTAPELLAPQHCQ